MKSRRPDKFNIQGLSGPSLLQLEIRIMCLSHDLFFTTLLLKLYLIPIINNHHRSQILPRQRSLSSRQSNQSTTRRLRRSSSITTPILNRLSIPINTLLHGEGEHLFGRLCACNSESLESSMNSLHNTKSQLVRGPLLEDVGAIRPNRILLYLTSLFSWFFIPNNFSAGHSPKFHVLVTCCQHSNLASCSSWDQSNIWFLNWLDQSS